jgi:hypothetical protein
LVPFTFFCVLFRLFPNITTLMHDLAKLTRKLLIEGILYDCWADFFIALSTQ